MSVSSCNSILVSKDPQFKNYSISEANWEQVRTCIVSFNWHRRNVLRTLGKSSSGTTASTWSRPNNRIYKQKEQAEEEDATASVLVIRFHITQRYYTKDQRRFPGISRNSFYRPSMAPLPDREMLPLSNLQRTKDWSGAVLGENRIQQTNLKNIKYYSGTSGAS